MNPGSSNVTFIVAAYAATWVAILAYAWRLHRRLARARTEFDRAAQGAPRP